MITGYIIKSKVTLFFCTKRSWEIITNFFFARNIAEKLLPAVWHNIRFHNWRVSNQNGVSLLYIMLEIHHSGWEPSNYDHKHSSTFLRFIGKIKVRGMSICKCDNRSMSTMDHCYCFPTKIQHVEKKMQHMYGIKLNTSECSNSAVKSILHVKYT